MPTTAKKDPIQRKILETVKQTNYRKAKYFALLEKYVALMEEKVRRMEIRK